MKIIAFCDITACSLVEVEVRTASLIRAMLMVMMMMMMMMMCSKHLGLLQRD
jgi:hypothetical protein